MNRNNGFPNCWICNDRGFILFVRNVKGFDYDVAVRCKCKEGQKTSDSVRTIDDEKAEKEAKENFLQFKERFPEKFV